MSASSASLAASQPGLVAVLGSGETAPAGRRVMGQVLARLAEPRTVTVLDSPAGFQPNHRLVAEKVARFIADSLGEYRPRVRVVETRRERLDTSGIDGVIRAIEEARCIVAGPGSPTYMLRELRDTAYLDAMRRAHQRGAALCVASAATVALGAYSIPVYEIFKAGEPPGWREGFDLLAPYGLRLALVPHWNNREGGADVDTSHCYLGAARFAAMRAELPEDVTILGIDEHTGCILDLAEDTGTVAGVGGLRILVAGQEYSVPTGATFPLSLLRRPGGVESAGVAWTAHASSLPASSLPAVVALADLTGGAQALAAADSGGIPPDVVEMLLAIRSDLRSAKQWDFADRIRDALAAAGITVEDTADGPRWQRSEASS